MVLPRRPESLQNPFQNANKRKNSWIVHRFLGAGLLLLACGSIWCFLGDRSNSLPPRPSRRFPEYDTEEFARQCPWIPVHRSRNEDRDRNFCITYVTPSPDENEGMADWLSKIVSAFIDARLRGCRLYLDYGPVIELEEVIRPVSSSDWRWWRDGPLSKAQHRNSGRLECNSADPDRPCVSFARRHSHNKVSRGQGLQQNRFPPSGIHIPSYRNVFKNLSVYNLYNDQFEDLFHTLEDMEASDDIGKDKTTTATTRSANITTITATTTNHAFHTPPAGGWKFSLATGFACSFSSTIQLAYPAAAHYQPNLFSDLLPALRAEDSFTIAVYIRTHATDRMASAEVRHKGGPRTKAEKENDEAYGGKDNEGFSGDKPTGFATSPQVQPVLRCLQELEDTALRLGGPPSSLFSLSRERDEPEDSVLAGVVSESLPPRLSRINWLVVSDSVPLKTWMAARYDDQPLAVPDSSSSFRTPVLRRRVLTTAARGLHTRASRNPATADFAEAFIDWYLLGESDLLLAGSRDFSFGTTAALRTAVPVLLPGSPGGRCARLPVVQEGASPPLGATHSSDRRAAPPQ